ncbi:MAG: hypothetical protein MH132_05385 [Hydrotalea sp.]|nr:hypothetical protein [Hydrotalea sp.]
MKNSQNPQETLREIKQLMEQSTRFLSLSGWSGITAGVSSIVGLAWLMLKIKQHPFQPLSIQTYLIEYPNTLNELLITAMLIFIVAAVGGVLFSWKKSKERSLPFWNAAAQRMLWHFAVPMISGGVVCLTMIHVGQYDLLAPLSLVFYGLAILNASKFTIPQTYYLGITQLLLGLLGCLIPNFGILIWGVGFGMVHLAYGIIMYANNE